MKKILGSIGMCSGLCSLLLGGCGTTSQSTSPYTSSSTDGIQPPPAWVKVGSQQIKMVINGYQWTYGNRTAIADAANDPAKHLHKYDESIGARVTLRFAQKPNTIQLAMWKNGNQVSESSLAGSLFRLPTTAGDYTYEVTGHWDNDYVTYDFAVHVH
ncbi:hypothetical protein [Alicyclobacillus sp. SO9]|uniref:hypothetical protein n=1 Tax=Alicyclobacillus sp. SO9 TaxID=2665646 RepID=UPI0018E84788|nr:hypothetical protein [Alicyclobacillus sp. SO9]QQE79282.1 hypothetical protein GI364_01870 [Alicyclobacillus sp. SO9]